MTHPARDKLEEHERIWLEPFPGADEEYGRQWCQQNVWGDEAAEYVLASAAESTLRTLQEEKQALRKANEWQPIEAAPHHQNVLVWREDAGEPWIAQYTDETFYDAEAGDSDRMDWFDLAGRYDGAETPTHWMPLPAAPVLQSKSTEADNG